MRVCVSADMLPYCSAHGEWFNLHIKVVPFSTQFARFSIRGRDSSRVVADTTLREKSRIPDIFHLESHR